MCLIKVVANGHPSTEPAEEAGATDTFHKRAPAPQRGTQSTPVATKSKDVVACPSVDRGGGGENTRGFCKKT